MWNSWAHKIKKVGPNNVLLVQVSLNWKIEVARLLEQPFWKKNQHVMINYAKTCGGEDNRSIISNAVNEAFFVWSK